METCACGADGRDSAPGKRLALILGHNEVWSLPLDSSSRHPFCHSASYRLKPTSPLTTVLRVVVSQPRLRRLLAFIQRHSFPVGQLPQPGKVPSPGASLRELFFESLTFQTA